MDQTLVIKNYIHGRISDGSPLYLNSNIIPDHHQVVRNFLALANCEMNHLDSALDQHIPFVENDFNSLQL